jgi:hypothetical protein
MVAKATAISAIYCCHFFDVLMRCCSLSGLVRLRSAPILACLFSSRKSYCLGFECKYFIDFSLDLVPFSGLLLVRLGRLCRLFFKSFLFFSRYTSRGHSDFEQCSCRLLYRTNSRRTCFFGFVARSDASGLNTNTDTICTGRFVA